MTIAAGLSPQNAREAIGRTLESLRDVKVYPYAPNADPDDVLDKYPCVIIRHSRSPYSPLGGDRSGFAGTFGPRGLANMSFDLELRTQSQDGITAEKAMDEYVAAGTGAGLSMWDALATDTTFGNVVGGSSVTNFTPPRPIAWGVWSATWTVTIQQRKS